MFYCVYGQMSEIKNYYYYYYYNHSNQISTKLTSFDNNEQPIILQISLRRRNCINNLVIYT